jgi:hypothetical protein
VVRPYFLAIRGGVVFFLFPVLIPPTTVPVSRVCTVQVRTISFSHDGVLLASASEDMKIDIGHVDTTEKVAEIPVDSPTFTVSWHPSR